MSENLGIIRQLYDLPTVVGNITGMDVHHVMVCPMPFHEHHHMSPSFGMFVDKGGVQRFKCFGQCGTQGDVIDFAGYYYLGAGYDANDPEQIKMALTYLRGNPISAQRTVLKKRGKPLDQRIVRPLVHQWERDLQTCDKALEYLEQRGIRTVAGQFHLGYRCVEPRYTKYEGKRRGVLPGQYLCIPTFQAQEIISVKLRRIPLFYGPDDIKPIRYDSVSGTKIGTGQPGIFNGDAVQFSRGMVLSPEGEFDVMLLAAMGFQACCVNGGANVMSERLALILAHADPVWIADNDEAGKRHAQAKQQSVGKGSIIDFAPFKDLGDYYGEFALEQTKDKLLQKLRDTAHVGH
jgi:DNA primase